MSTIRDEIAHTETPPVEGEAPPHADNGLESDGLEATGGNESSSPWARRLAGVAAVALPLWAVLRVIAVDFGGIVTNDSIGYIARGREPFGQGFVVQGYRQVGYPIFLWLNDRAAGWFDWDRLFGVSLLQRLILIAGIVLCWAVLRWWSVPLLVFVTAPTYVIHADLLLNEGILIPLSLLSGIGACAVLRRFGPTRTWPLLWLVALTALPVIMGTMKLQYSVLLLLAAAAAVLLVREAGLDWRHAVAVLLAAVVVLGGLVVVQSFENRRETGVFEPVSEQARADWYGAYQVVFTLHTENRNDDRLAEFYDDGDLYVFLHGLERDEPDYLVRRERIEDRVERMLEAAGLSKRGEQFASVVGALGGGRMDDIRGIIDQSLDGSEDARPRYSFNRVGSPAADEAVVIWNDGAEVGSLSIGPLGEVVPAPLGDHRPWNEFVGYISLVLLLIGALLSGRQRWLSVATLLAIGSVAVVLGSAYIDNARYLLGPLTVGFTVALAACAELWDTRLRSSSREPRRTT